MQDGYDRALEYGQKQPPKEPDIRTEVAYWHGQMSLAHR